MENYAKTVDHRSRPTLVFLILQYICVIFRRHGLQDCNTTTHLNQSIAGVVLWPFYSTTSICSIPPNQALVQGKAKAKRGTNQTAASVVDILSLSATHTGIQVEDTLLGSPFRLLFIDLFSQRNGEVYALL